MGEERAELLKGTLDMLILKITALGPIHGYGIALRIQQISQDFFQLQQGSLYPALHRLEDRGWLKSLCPKSGVKTHFHARSGLSFLVLARI